MFGPIDRVSTRNKAPRPKRPVVVPQQRKSSRLRGVEFVPIQINEEDTMEIPTAKVRNC